MASTSMASLPPVSPLAISLLALMGHTLAPTTVSRRTRAWRAWNCEGNVGWELEGGPRPLPFPSLNPGGGWFQGSVGKLF